MPLDIQQLILKARRQLAAKKEAEEAKKKAKLSSHAEIQRFLDNILNWEYTTLILQELHQTCNCCGSTLKSVNSVMVQRRNKMTYAVKTSVLQPDHTLDLQSLERTKLIVEQEIPMCPDCFQLSELIDLCHKPVSIGLESAQKDLFL